MQDHGSRYLRSSDWQAQKWEQLASLIRSMGTPLGAERALDLGCGTGARTAHIPLLFPDLKSILAIDSDASMLATAERNNHHERIEYKHLPMEKLDTVDTGQVDFILAHYSLHWCSDKERLLETLKDNTRPGSMLAVGTCDDLPDLFKVIEHHLLAELGPQDGSPFYYLTLEGWQALLERYGWRIHRVIRTREPHPIPSGEEFLKTWCAASAGKAFYGKTYESISRACIETIISDLNSRYSCENPDAWEFHEDTLLFVAERD